MSDRLTRRTAYEWDLESYDEYGDIIDHYFHEKCPTESLPEDGSTKLVLVKSEAVGYPDDEYSYDIDHRTWAYVDADGQLPEFFCDGSKVPQRLRKEFDKARGVAR